MNSGTLALAPAELALLTVCRRGVLATSAADGRARLVPITYAVAPWTDMSGRTLLYSALDEKPKSVADPRQLARVRDIAARPKVTLLVDRWSEDWSELAWLRLEGEAALVEPAAAWPDPGRHADAVRLLRQRYPQYAGHRLEERPVLRMVCHRAVSWGLGAATARDASA